jgi:hypothetical protein
MFYILSLSPLPSSHLEAEERQERLPIHTVGKVIVETSGRHISLFLERPVLSAFSHLTADKAKVWRIGVAVCVFTAGLDITALFTAAVAGMGFIVFPHDCVYVSETAANNRFGSMLGSVAHYYNGESLFAHQKPFVSWLRHGHSFEQQVACATRMLSASDLNAQNARISAWIFSSFTSSEISPVTITVNLFSFIHSHLSWEYPS